MCIRDRLYTPQTDKCVFVGTAMLEWNKSIDKLANYDETMIVPTADFSPALAEDVYKRQVHSVHFRQVSAQQIWPQV